MGIITHHHMAMEAGDLDHHLHMGIITRPGDGHLASAWGIITTGWIIGLEFWRIFSSFDFVFVALEVESWILKFGVWSLEFWIGFWNLEFGMSRVGNPFATVYSLYHCFGLPIAYTVANNKKNSKPTFGPQFTPLDLLFLSTAVSRAL